MARKSKRELERVVEDLDPDGDETTVKSWVYAQFEEAAVTGELGCAHTVVNSDGEVVEQPDHEGQVCAIDGWNYGLWIAEADIPEWIDTDEDLPITEGNS